MTVQVKFAGAADKDLWNGFVAGAPNPHVLQSWEWGEFKAAYGWQPIRLLFYQEGRLAAAASMLKRAVGPVSMCYVPKGPAVDFGDQELAGQVLDTILKIARRQRAIYVKIDPDVHLEDERARRLIEDHGFRRGEDIQRPNTMLLDISGSEDEVLGR
ncbi:MAG TPA: peptidoglycan bridge formation glycyltransferase FemA/FemB family protein, partial [Chloroflexota bacterium]|nr:peptidoglycan bridge formation glycyltransferase FemA/FemB family protein [Chloroflexota bacterium]